MISPIRCARFGDLVLQRASGNSFELIRLTEGKNGNALARISVERSAVPELRITRIPNETRLLSGRPKAVGDRVVLADCREGTPDCFRLTAEREDDHLTLILSGDSHAHAGRPRLRLFWWRAELGVKHGELVVRGPFLTDDSFS